MRAPIFGLFLILLAPNSSIAQGPDNGLEANPQGTSSQVLRRIIALEAAVEELKAQDANIDARIDATNGVALTAGQTAADASVRASNALIASDDATDTAEKAIAEANAGKAAASGAQSRADAAFARADKGVADALAAQTTANTAVSSLDNTLDCEVLVSQGPDWMEGRCTPGSVAMSVGCDAQNNQLGEHYIRPDGVAICGGWGSPKTMYLTCCK